MHIESNQCAVPGCYGKPIFAGLCNEHCTKGAAVEQAQRVLREKVKVMPDMTGYGGPVSQDMQGRPGIAPDHTRRMPQGGGSGIESNDIVSVNIGHDRRGTDAKMSFKYPKYYKEIPAGTTELDIYLVCNIFQVQDYSGALHHAIKKLLLPGVRTGGKTRRDDIKEARDTLTRWLEINK